MTDRPTTPADDEDRIRAALAAIADTPGRADEAGAWAQVRADIAASPARRRHRALLGLSATAAAAAAVVGVLVLSTQDDRQSVEVGPLDTGTTLDPGPSTSSPAEGATTTSVADTLPAGFPARPLAVVVDENGAQRLDLYDADTGAPVTKGLARSAFSIDEVSFGPDGTVYFTQELGDTSTVRAVPWDGSTEPVTPFGAGNEDGNESRSPAITHDGLTFAYVHQGLTVDQSEIVIVDIATGTRRALGWAPDEQDFFRTGGHLSGLEWSPAGDRLLFVLSYEGAEPHVLDATATSLSEATPITGLSAYRAHWSGKHEVVGINECCYPEHDEPHTLRRVGLGGETSTVTEAGEPLDFDIDNEGRLAIVRADGTVALIDEHGAVTELTIAGTVLSVGF